jgi:hypothetical protein
VNLLACGAVGRRDQTFHILTADVDATNGNRKLALEAIRRYQVLRGQFPASGAYADSTAFASEIVHYDWHIQLPNAYSFAAGLDCLNAMRTRNDPDELALMRLFYTNDEMGFDFSKEGFHAIPAIGAPVMQYILAEGIGSEPFYKYVSIIRSEISANSHLILTGSIFGGTGACGIPSLMREFRNATQDYALSGTLHTHAVLLLPYYHFMEPGKDKVDAQNMPMSVQARRFYSNARGALAYYGEMERELGYESLYLLGSPVDFNMGEYHPGMEKQQNPPTVVEWEAALAIEHCVTQLEVPTEANTYLHSVLAGDDLDMAQTIKVNWEQFSAPIGRKVAAMVRFCAAYNGYYKDYINRNARRTRGLKPFFSELIQPYLIQAESETQAFETLSAFCARFWQWANDSFRHGAITQNCLTERMMNAKGYPFRTIPNLIAQMPSPKWTHIEDAVFDGIRPYRGEDAQSPEMNAGLFLHGLFAHCAL